MNKGNNLVEWIQKSGMDRRTFLKSCGSLALLLGMPFQMRDVFAATTAATAIPDHITLTWLSDPATTQTIAWRTDTSVSNGFVQISQGLSGRGATASAQTVASQVETLKSSLGDAYLHSATVTGLKPGVTYNYRVGSGTNFSPVSTFTTAQQGATAFKFLLFGDSQSGMGENPEYGPFQITTQNALNAHPDARFFINVGDLTEDGQDYLHWNNWFLACKDILTKIPAMPAQGNHETYNRGWLPPSGSGSEPYEYVHQFKLPQNGPTGLRTQDYSWDYGNVHFTVIDSQYYEEAADTTRFAGSAFLDMQKAWLDNDLKSTTKPWKIVIFHRTPYYNKATRANDLIKEAFVPIIDKYHVDVVFNGHDHAISRTYPMKNNTMVSSPGAGTIYYVTGRSGNKTYGDLSKKVWDAYFYNSVDQPSYVAAQVNGSILTLTAYKQNGTVLDTYSINKSGSDYPVTVLPTRSVNTQVAVYGSVVSASTAVQINSKWYVSLNFVTASNLGGTYSFNAASNQATVTYSGKTFTFTVGSATVGTTPSTLANAIILQNGVPMIASDDIKIFFFYTGAVTAIKYDANINILYISSANS